MEILYNIIGFLIMICIIFAPLFGLFYLIKFLWRNVIHPIGTRNKHINLNYIEAVLFNRFSYYQRLNTNDKTKFLNRVEEFIVAKEFGARQDLVLTDDMKILISASAIQ